MLMFRKQCMYLGEYVTMDTDTVHNVHKSLRGFTVYLLTVDSLFMAGKKFTSKSPYDNSLTLHCWPIVY